MALYGHKVPERVPICCCWPYRYKPQTTFRLWCPLSYHNAPKLGQLCHEVFQGVGLLLIQCEALVQQGICATETSYHEYICNTYILSFRWEICFPYEQHKISHKTCLFILLLWIISTFSSSTSNMSWIHSCILYTVILGLAFSKQQTVVYSRSLVV